VIVLLGGLVAGAVLAVLVGGDLRRLDRAPLAHVWMFAAAAAAQIVLFTSFVQTRFAGPWLGWIYVATMLMVFVGVALNFRVHGMGLATFGIGLNLVAIVANGGYMPLALGAARRLGWMALFVRPAGAPPGTLISNNSIISPAARLPLLGDWILLKAGPLSTCFSIGDSLLTLGAVWLVLYYSQSRGRRAITDDGLLRRWSSRGGGRRVAAGM
jgi:hypothetical protein